MTGKRQNKQIETLLTQLKAFQGWSEHADYEAIDTYLRFDLDDSDREELSEAISLIQNVFGK